MNGAECEVRVFTTAPEDGWRTLVGKYGPVWIRAGFGTREAAQAFADDVTRSDKPEYGIVWGSES